jgi:hypothetical protein
MVQQYRLVTSFRLPQKEKSMGKRGHDSLDPEKRGKVLEMLKSAGHLTDNAISKDVGVSAKTVKKLRTKHDEEMNGPFFSQRLNKVSPEELMNICQDPSFDPSPATTKVRNDKDLPEISKFLLDKHRLQTYSSDSKGSLVQKYKEGGKDFHGFWIASPDESFDAAAVTTTTEFVDMVEKDPTILEMMPSIFEFSQNVKTTSKSSELTQNQRRMGDNKRKHLVWTEWIAELTRRLTECQANVRKLDQDLQAAQAVVARFASVIPEKDRETRHTKDFTQSHAEKAAAAQARCVDLQRQLVEAEKARATALEYEQRTVKVEKLMCDNYERIIHHSPYGTVHRTITERDLLSLILALPDANSQTMHGDSLQVGCSLLMALREKQYLIILLNGFKAMRSLDRMLAKRTEALNYVRDRIAAQAPEGWIARNWNAKAEHRVWNYLCCLQFEHEGIGAITAVRVPIEVGETLVVDNRTLHGGSRGMEGRNGFRFHTYGYDRDLRKKRERGDLDDDSDVTIDPLELKLGFYPVCRWAQRTSVFRV